MNAIHEMADRERMNFGFLSILFRALNDSNNPAKMAKTT